jgi:transposase
MIGWLAQRMDKTSITRLLRCSWEAVDRTVKQVVADHLDDARLNELYRIGVDEISYKRGHSYLTIVCDHDTGRVVWVATNKTKKAFDDFFCALGPERARKLQAITMDGSTIYAPVAADRAPQATICLDPFHIIKWAGEALDKVHQAHPPPRPPKPTAPTKPHSTAPTRNWRRLRSALRSGKENLDADRRRLINALRRHRYMLYRAWELKEKLRDLYRKTPRRKARAHLKNWITEALRSRIGPIANLALRLRRHFNQIIAAVELGLSNSRAEGINSKIRVIQRRGYGHPTPDSLTAMIHLCLGGIRINLPTQT